MERIFRYTLTILISILALGQFTQVITRYVLELPLMGLEESLIYPSLWLYMIGAVNASRENTQIRANVLDIFFDSEKAKAIIAAISDAISLVVGSWLLYWAWDYTKYSLRVGKESPTLYWPTIYADIALFCGLVLILMYIGFHLINQIKVIYVEKRHG